MKATVSDFRGVWGFKGLGFWVLGLRDVGFRA